MSNSDQAQEQIASHLKTLGYEVTREDESILASHPQKLAILLKGFSEGVLHTSVWQTNDDAKRNRQGLIEYVNALNQGAVAVRYYVDEDLDLFVEGLYVGGYDRTRYGQFLDLWDTDFKGFLQAPETNRYLE